MDDTTATPAEIKRSSIMRRFEEIIEANPDRPIYIAELCRELGVADRTLRSNFHDVLGMSPYRYLVLRRMQLARRRLAAASVDGATVTRIAMDCGFSELGRFSVYYRRLFGESPSATLKGPSQILDRARAWAPDRPSIGVSPSGVSADIHSLIESRSACGR